MAGDWSDEQNDAIVADYFAMLGDDIAGCHAFRNRGLLRGYERAMALHF